MSDRINPMEQTTWTEYQPLDGKSILPEDTTIMEIERRIVEQAYKKRYAKLHSRKEDQKAALAVKDAAEGNRKHIPNHPYLQSQRFAGIEQNITPLPNHMNDREIELYLENERRNQEQEKQLRLGLMPQMGKRTDPQFNP